MCFCSPLTHLHTAPTFKNLLRLSPTDIFINWYIFTNFLTIIGFLFNTIPKVKTIFFLIAIVGTISKIAILV